MSGIIFTVTRRALTQGRLNTEQTYPLNRFTGVTLAQPSFNRPVAMSMDRLSSRGTFVASSEELTLDFIVPISEKAEIDELLYSLADYQDVQLVLSDRPHIGADYTAKLLGDSFPRSLIGCSHIQGSMRFQIIQ